MFLSPSLKLELGAGLWAGLGGLGLFRKRIGAPDGTVIGYLEVHPAVSAMAFGLWIRRLGMGKPPKVLALAFASDPVPQPSCLVFGSFH